MSDKEFKSIQEQIQILTSRGLSISDKAVAERFLLRNNYYRISGYSLTLRNHDVFYKQATLQNVMDIYDFDHEFRHLLLKYLDHIEVAFKSIYAYEFTKEHGATGYREPSYFTDLDQHKRILANGDAQKERRHLHEAYLKHFIDDLHQDIPLWAYVDLLTISDISFMYKISEESIKKAVANHFGLQMAKGTTILGQFMHSMTIIRNLCAHGSRLFNRLFEQKPSLNSKEKQLLIRLEDGSNDNAHLYGFLLIMRRLLCTNEFCAMKSEIVSLSEKYPFVAMRHYGFRDDWKEKL